MRIKDVDVVQPHPFKRLVTGGDEVLARPTLPIRAWPHIVASLGTNNEFVPVGLEISRHDATEIDLGLSIGRTVIISEVEVGDAAIESATQHGTLRRSGVKISKNCATTLGRQRGVISRSFRNVDTPWCRNDPGLPHRCSLPWRQRTYNQTW